MSWRWLDLLASGPRRGSPSQENVMPFVEIFVPEKRPADQRRKLADAVHHALVEAIAIPEDDRFQVLRALPEGDYIADPSYLGVKRSRNFLVVRVTLRRGRSIEKKRALYRAIADNTARAVGMRTEDVFVVLHENEASDWSFGAGIAQYAPAE
jgi:phenylpyruvate tautomerase PptA (4-oxalocrotonate tautomerase family)